MTAVHRLRDTAPLLGFALLLLTPGVAIRCGLIPFDMRFEALLIVSALCVGLVAAAGYNSAELGLRAPFVARHWQMCGIVTAGALAAIYLEAQLFTTGREQPDWMKFAPFYVLVSSPLQELVCRVIPKLITDKLRLSSAKYMFFSAASFSLMHLAYGDALLLANTFFVGLAWAAAYQATRNVWPVAASHAAVGTFAFWLGVA
ncbi:CPBP family intramembrane glutamic endopeptidase [Methylocystis parvus]|uniref:CPBP family intramembrane metalloprotease n=1 Tax=Methylocystis parvus TaxID=134 RepID=A0A6B8M1V5_9HYPH|nr:CPBP family intramembrane glutamic endopeptidase [Methylocystis parvus]QGM98857.1 CPBP family intramembrane metalloprotease [Methylocystis parvus]WBK00790.1 CPBP family intramembrane metalloprotease [Methylocystis parvus OBBP]